MAQVRTKARVKATSPKVTILSKDQVTRLLHRNDRFLSFLNEEEAAITEDDKTNQEIERIEAKPDIGFTDLWTEAKIEDMMLQCLSRAQVIITGRVKVEDRMTNRVYKFDACYRVPKYSEEAAYIARFAAYSEDARILTIHLSDLGQQIQSRLFELEEKRQRCVVTAVGKKLFRLYYPHYFNYIGDLLKVEARL